MTKIYNNENLKSIQSKPKKIWLDLIWFDFKTKTIGWTNNKTEEIESYGFSSQNRTNRIREHSYFQHITDIYYLLECDIILFVVLVQRCLSIRLIAVFVSFMLIYHYINFDHNIFNQWFKRQCCRFGGMSILVTLILSHY